MSLLLCMFILEQIFREFYGVLWSKTHNCGWMRCEHMRTYHTAARPNPESSFQCLIGKFQGISSSDRDSSAARPHWGTMMGPVS